MEGRELHVAGADSIGKRKDGRFVFRRGFFFRLGIDAAIFKSEIMPYVGGVGAYRQRCSDVAAKGYTGFSVAST